MKKGIILASFVLLVLLNILLLMELGDVHPDNAAYIPNQENGYTLVQTKFGAFPISIAATNKINDGTELSLILVNPLNIRFGEAEVWVQTTQAPTKVTLDVVPGTNILKAKVASIERGELIKIGLELDKIYFK